ncbi:MAG: histidine kinase [Flavobacteriaceae bacterium]
MRVKKKELFIFVCFYFFWAVFYYTALWYNSNGPSRDDNPYFDVMSFIDDVGLDYLIKALLTYPIWYLLFRKLKKWNHAKKILLHIILLPAFVLIWQQLYYATSEALGLFHLFGAASAWDIYIPALFYVLQFGVIHSYNYYEENQEKLKLESELRTAALKSELSALKAQLNPHFLYNVFNTISASVPAENEKTRKMIAELSDLFRYQLKASQVDKVPLEEELDFINKYLELEKERFQERLKIEFDIDQDILKEEIPPMLLQPLVENSIKHGLSSLIEGGIIIIRIKRKNEKLIFEIIDTGVGIKDKEAVFGKGIGLKNTKLRLEKVYQSNLYLSDNLPRGLKISFEL